MISVSFSLTFCSGKNTPEIISNVIVRQESGHFFAWPANNGIWIWQDDEIVVGFTGGTFVEKEGHNIEAPYYNLLSRSNDGGYSWEIIEDQGFIGIYDPDDSVGNASLTLRVLEEPLRFENESFMLRVIANGYLQPGLEYPGGNESQGGFFYSYDRGNTWSGPYVFNGLSESEELQGMEITSRTDYLIKNDETALMFLSARIPGVRRTDKPFVARTIDGGLTFEFTGWMVSPDDPYRAVMPSTVKTTSGKLVSAIRRRAVDGNDYCWIDVYTSNDDGKTWQFTGRGGETGIQNGNPPALIQLNDGRLLLVYANREHHQIRARFSSNDGLTWGPELILREGNERDIGYPAIVQNRDGNIVTTYYWADSPDSEKYIEALIWDPGDKDLLDRPVKLELPR